jgi:hypothetical protein
VQALVSDFLEIGAKRAAAGYVVVATQQLAGMTHEMCFFADSAAFCHNG